MGYFSTEYIIVALVILVVCVWAGGVIYEKKGRAKGNGQGLGCLLGPLGVLIAFLVPDNPKGIEEHELGSGEKKKCPFCAEMIKKEAIVCRYCGNSLETTKAQTNGETHGLSPRALEIYKKYTSYNIPDYKNQHLLNELEKNGEQDVANQIRNKTFKGV
jgi:hypothetical protein